MTRINANMGRDAVFGDPAGAPRGDPIIRTPLTCVATCVAQTDGRAAAIVPDRWNRRVAVRGAASGVSFVVELNILCIGDVVGRPGRHVLSHALPRLVRERGVDCVIANVENAAGGSGLTASLYEKFSRYGVDVQTLGDHAFKRGDIFPVLQKSERLIRPANMPSHAPGRGTTVFVSEKGPAIGIMTVLGRLYMKPPTDCPYAAVDRWLSTLPPDVRIVVVEIHGEVTAEKVAMGWHLDGRASIVFGTHTHIPTADERVLPNGTAYITDLGMTGPYDSVLGRRKDRVVSTLLTGIPSAFDVATGDVRLCGILVRVDGDSGRAQSIERVCVPDTFPDGGENDAD